MQRETDYLQTLSRAGPPKGLFHDSLKERNHGQNLMIPNTDHSAHIQRLNSTPNKLLGSRWSQRKLLSFAYCSKFQIPPQTMDLQSWMPFDGLIHLAMHLFSKLGMQTATL